MSTPTANEFLDALCECMHKAGTQMTHLVYFADHSWYIETGDEVIESGQGLWSLGAWMDEILDPESPDSASGGAA